MQKNSYFFVQMGMYERVCMYIKKKDYILELLASDANLDLISEVTLGTLVVCSHNLLKEEHEKS